MQSIGSAALLVALAVAVYLGRLAWAPFVPCRRCGGAGERRPRFHLRTVQCARCGGLGERLRLGMRAWHAWQGYGR